LAAAFSDSAKREAIMLQNVMPKRSEFFNLLAAHSDRLVAGANATMRLITGLGTHAGQESANDAGLIEEVNLNETSADEIKTAFTKLLFESFTTPINRDQLHALIRDLDRVLDTLQSVANNIAVYNIADSTAAARTMSSLAADACLRLNRAVIALADRNGGPAVRKEIGEIDALDVRANEIMRDAVTRLFENEGDDAAAFHAMKMRRFYLRQAKVLDRCLRVARTIEEILLENA
jgi:uncharacterized protein Yka (UPF0111/DUF47 family)